MRLPLFLLIWGVAAMSMYVPAIHALSVENYDVSRVFFYGGTLGLFVVTLLGIAMNNRQARNGTLGQLLSLFATFALLPLFLAVPMQEGLRNTTFLNAYFDMVSALTTTGADIFPDPLRRSSSLHLWRGQVAWLGGFLMWVAAAAILAPLSLGGFEITARGDAKRGSGMSGLMQVDQVDPQTKLWRTTKTLAPIYGGLTLLVWIFLMMLGESTLTGLIHAMSVMSTSGISPVGGLDGSSAGWGGEFVLFCFMVFALSRTTFSSDTVLPGTQNLLQDPEVRIGLTLVASVSVLIFARHWIAALEFQDTENLSVALRAIWGTLFTAMSFLTTTGFESTDWQIARDWSGIGTPGLILLGLALIGGGVATTAGGVKLLRVFALYLNGLREMERLVYPSSVSGAGARNRRIQKDGAFIAWVFFMLFAMSLALISAILAALGSDFEQAIILSIATLSTTGPLIEVAGDTPIRLVELGPWTKAVLCAAMILGRLEALAIVALLSPTLWRS
ncbi:TrkH family potassium uptake protein [Chachezhania antarctica]|uniref:TrkH family potassium uptake protein n=1 Tax=Chachezhania antarctica TaxID=2340860 RepID=UPI001F08B480|nr:potassium transporter TrkG [Chachezhania antarctica]